jgi:hypothetical protein
MREQVGGGTPLGPAPDPLAVGTPCYHRGEAVRIVAVHREEGQPYYTVAMEQGGAERQAESMALSLWPPDVEPDVRAEITIYL